MTFITNYKDWLCTMTSTSHSKHTHFSPLFSTSSVALHYMYTNCTLWSVWRNLLDAPPSTLIKIRQCSSFWCSLRGASNSEYLPISPCISYTPLTGICGAQVSQMHSFHHRPVLIVIAICPCSYKGRAWITMRSSSGTGLANSINYRQTSINLGGVPCT